MDLNQAKADIRRGLGYKTALDASILAALQSVQRTLEEGLSLPDFLLTYDAVIAGSAGVAVFTLPERFLRLSDKFDLYYLDPDVSGGRTSIPLKTETEGLSAYGSITDSTHAKVWALRGKTEGIFLPTPTDAATYYLTYYKGEPPLTNDNLENKWLTYLPDIMIGTAGLEVCNAIGYKEGEVFFTRRLARGEKARMGGIVDSELQGRPLIMGRNK